MTDTDVSEVRQTIRRHWNERAATFDAGPTHGLLTDEQRAAWSALVAEWAGPVPVDALDVGCGTGFLALLLAGHGHRAAGVDLAEAMLAKARAKAAERGLPVSFENAAAERLPFGPAAFDLVVERHVLWTLPDPVAALREWARVLRPGGHLVLVEGAWQTEPHPDYTGIADALPLHGGRPAAEIAALVAGAGFTRLHTEPLMAAALWGGPPSHERYALHGYRPGP